MSPLSLEEFEQLLLSTRLVTEQQLQEAVSRVQRRTGDPPADCLTLARQLGRMGLITAWQNHKLLSGDADGYFFGDAKLLAHLNTGLTSEIYQARRPGDDQEIALKVLAPPWSNSHRQLDELRDQIEQASELEHPNLVRVFGLETQGALIAIASELVGAASVTRRIAGERSLDCLQAAQIIRQAAAALTALHEAGLVHGRLCPSKLLVDTRNGVKVVDPGLSVLAEVALMEQIPGRDASLVDCVAPEQAIDPTCMTPSVDLYALGCCLHVLLCGQMPYPSGDVNQRLFARQQGVPPDVRQRRPDAPAELAALCQALLSRRPQDRPASAEAVMSELDSFLHRADAEMQGWGEGDDDDSSLTQMVGEATSAYTAMAPVVVAPADDAKDLSDSHILHHASETADDDASATFIGKHDSAIVEAVSLEVAGEADDSGVMDELEFPAVDDPNTPTTLASLSDIREEDEQVKLVTRGEQSGASDAADELPPAADEDWSDSDIEGPEPGDETHEPAEDSEFALDELGTQQDSGTLTASHSAIRRAGNADVRLETPEDSHALAGAPAESEFDDTPVIFTEFDDMGTGSGTVTGSLSDIKRAGEDEVALEIHDDAALIPPSSTTPYDSGPIVISQELDQVREYDGTITGSLSDIKRAGEDAISMVTQEESSVTSQFPTPEAPYDAGPIVISQELDEVGNYGGTVTGSLSDIKRAGDESIFLQTPEQPAEPAPPAEPLAAVPIVISQELDEVGNYGGTVTGSLSDIKRAGEDPISVELAGDVAMPPEIPDAGVPIVISQELNDVGQYGGTVTGSLSDIKRAGDEAIFLHTPDQPSDDAGDTATALPPLSAEGPSFSDLAEDEPEVCDDVSDEQAPVAEAAPPGDRVPLRTAGDTNLHYAEDAKEADTPTEIRRTRAKMNEMLKSFGEEDGAFAEPMPEPGAADEPSGSELTPAEVVDAVVEEDDESFAEEESFALRGTAPSDAPSPEEFAEPTPAHQAPTLSELVAEQEAADSGTMPDTELPPADELEPALEEELDADAETLDIAPVAERHAEPADTATPVEPAPAAEPPHAIPDRPAPPIAPQPSPVAGPATPHARPAFEQNLALAQATSPGIAMTWGNRASAAFGLFAFLALAGLVISVLAAGVVNLATQFSELLLVIGALVVVCLALAIAARPYQGSDSSRQN